MFSFFQKPKTKEEALMNMYEELSKQENFFKIEKIEGYYYRDSKIMIQFKFGEYQGVANVELIENSGENILVIQKEEIFQKIKEERIGPEEFLKSNFGLQNTLLIGQGQTTLETDNGNEYKISKREKVIFAVQLLETSLKLETNCKIEVLDDFIKENFLNFIKQLTEETKKRLVSEFQVLSQKEQIEQDELIDKELKKLLNVNPLDKDMQTKFKILNKIEGIYENIKTEHEEILKLREDYFSI